MLTNPMTQFGEGEEQRSLTSLPVIAEGNVLYFDGNIYLTIPLVKQSLLVCTSTCTSWQVKQAFELSYLSGQWLSHVLVAYDHLGLRYSSLGLTQASSHINLPAPTCTPGWSILITQKYNAIIQFRKSSSCTLSKPSRH